MVWSEEIKIMRMRKAIWFAQWQIVYDLYDHLTELDKMQLTGVIGKQELPVR